MPLALGASGYGCSARPPDPRRCPHDLSVARPSVRPRGRPAPGRRLLPGRRRRCGAHRSHHRRPAGPGRPSGRRRSRPGTVGAVTTGRTTAKASLLQGTKLSGILSSHPKQAREAYVEANREGLAWVQRFCDDHGVEVQSRDAVVYAAKPSELSVGPQGAQTADSLGLDVRWADDLDVPFPNHGATVLPGTRSSSTRWSCSRRSSTELRAHGGTLHEGLPGATRCPGRADRRCSWTTAARSPPTTSCWRPASRSSTGAMTFAKVGAEALLPARLPGRRGARQAMYLSAGLVLPVAARRTDRRRHQRLPRRRQRPHRRAHRLGGAAPRRAARSGRTALPGRRWRRTPGRRRTTRRTTGCR